MELTAIAAIVSAACAVVQLLRRRERTVDSNAIREEIPPDIVVESSEFVLVALTLNTYDDAEIRSIRNRLAKCRDDFERTLNGCERCKCICRVLRQVVNGNGGALPNVKGWNETFDQLCRPSAR